jgi:uncharacterized glyoxalase superfamily protein PhnB
MPRATDMLRRLFREGFVSPSTPRRPFGPSILIGARPRADIDRAYQELLDAGAHSYKAPWDAFWQQRYAQVTDPDGNIIDLFAPL